MDKIVTLLLQAVQDAGQAILGLQKTGFAIEKKTSGEIVTKADLLANDILKSQLTMPFPNYGWLSEESVREDKRLQCDRVWIVDPIDGTKEYASGLPEYAISVALVEKGVPILAAVFNPATDECFHAIKNQGAWLNHQKINCDEMTSSYPLLLASRSEYRRGEWARYQAHYRIKPIGSIAYKLALVAAGQAQATFSLGPKNEWDIAAGCLLVSEAQGIVTNKQQEYFIFNRPATRVDGVVATTPLFHAEVVKMIVESVV